MEPRQGEESTSLIKTIRNKGRVGLRPGGGNAQRLENIKWEKIIKQGILRGPLEKGGLVNL